MDAHRALVRRVPVKRAAAVLAAVLLCAMLVRAGATSVAQYPRDMGAGPAGPPLRETQGVWSMRPVHFVGLGDSVTAGFGARDGYGYFDRIVRDPVDGSSLRRVFPKLMVENRAVSGSTSVGHVRQVADMPVTAPDVLGWVVMTTGGNDLIHNYGRTPPRADAMYGASTVQARPWIAAFEARLDGMLRTISSKFPGGCRIFLATIYDPTDGVGDIERAGLPPWPDGEQILAAYNDVIRRVARRHEMVRVVDVHGLFLGHGLHCKDRALKYYRPEDPHYWYYANLEDPNERGYDALRRLFLNEMAAAGVPRKSARSPQSR
ncbi:MAG: SGNH/GDSL hydrolase family protein [Armatimonadetes bacterium]|nr:SGNH/GDSL hydrolase family protein [Armatimonadota bacterium]